MYMSNFLRFFHEGIFPLFRVSYYDCLDNAITYLLNHSYCTIGRTNLSCSSNIYGAVK